MRINLMSNKGVLIASKAVANIGEAKEFIRQWAELLGYAPVPVIERSAR